MLRIGDFSTSRIMVLNTAPRLLFVVTPPLCGIFERFKLTNIDALLKCYIERTLGCQLKYQKAGSGKEMWKAMANDSIWVEIKLPKRKHFPTIFSSSDRRSLVYLKKLHSLLTSYIKLSFYKIIKGQAPSYLCDKLELLKFHHRYNTKCIYTGI